MTTASLRETTLDRPDALSRSAARRILRATIRTVALVLLTISLYFAWGVRDLLLVTQPGARRAWRLAIFRAWARSVAALAGMRIRVRGAVPVAPFLLVSNHLSYMDVVALSTVLDCLYVAKGDVARWPGIGHLCRKMKVIFVDRGQRSDVRRVAGEILRTYRDGEGVVLFPEGTSTPGTTVGPFRSSLLEPAAAEGLPVHHASIGYRTPAGERPAWLAVCWWGDMTFAKHLFELFQLPGFDADLVFGDRPIEGDDRKLLAEALHGAVSERFTPIVSMEGEWSETTY